MLFDLYKYTVATVSAALFFLWYVQPLWGAFELFCLAVLVFPLYIPLLYRLGVKLWVARRRRQLGLPAARDRDIIDFIGEELDRVGVAWQWRVALRHTSNWDEIEVGEDDEPPVTVRVRNGLVEVSNEADGATRFVDPVAAVDRILALYGGARRPDEEIYAEPEEAAG